MEDHNAIEELYRDTISTVDQTGKRIWIYPKKPRGRFYNYRKVVSYALLIILFALPWIKVNDQPFMLFNIPQNKFILFGVYFAPQDFHLFVIAMLILIIFIILFTVIYGRLFCGWVCPQTIFMEMVFRRIEYWIEGDAKAQKRLNKAPWDFDKIWKKTLKQIIFILIAIVISHTFLSYIIGSDAVLDIVTSPPSQNWSGFIAMIVFTAVFYGVFSHLREQVCTTICPYGRLQGVMLDENSLAVSYDFERGEPRGKLKRKAKAEPVEMVSKQGDCIDCTLCVQVCPTGIDIRNGTQLECVNCTACIDACDEVMDKIKKPRGLIRIDSYNGILEGKQNRWNKRVLAYSFVLLALVGIEIFMFSNRSDVEVLMLRTPGMLYQEPEEGVISNLYNYQLINKTDHLLDVEFKCKNIPEAEFQAVGAAPKTKSNENTEGAVFIKIPEDLLEGRKTSLTIEVYGNGELIDKTTTSFLGPIK